MPGFSKPPVLLVPAITIGVAAVAVVVLATPREILAVKLLGGPTEGTGEQSVRVVCERHAIGVEDRVPLDALDVTIGSRSTQVACNEQGEAEVPYESRADADGGLDVRVERRGVVLARGHALVTLPMWLAGETMIPAQLARGAENHLRVRARVTGGILPMHEPSFVRLEVERDGVAIGCEEKLVAAATGADTRPITCADGRFEVAITPTFPNASLHVALASDPEHASWDERLPVVVPVGRVARRERDAWFFDFAVPAIHLAAIDESGRRRATWLARGAPARIDAWGTPGDRSWLQLAGDPDDLASITSYPQRDGDDGRVVRDVLWIDGLPPLLAADRERTRRGGLAVAALVLIGALLEAILLLERSREAQAALRRVMAEAEGAPLEKPETRSNVLVAVAALLFGFAILGVIFVVGSLR